MAAKKRKGIRGKQKIPDGYEFLALANQYRRAGMYEQALKVCRVGLKNFPDYVSARAALGVILFESGQKDEAVAELEAVLEVSPANLLTHRVLAKLHLESGNMAEASKAYETILWLAPEDADAQEKLESMGSLEGMEAVQESSVGVESAEDLGLPPEEDLELPSEFELPSEEESGHPEEDSMAEKEPPAEAAEGTLVEAPEPKAETAAKDQAPTGRVGELAAFRGTEFPELADMDISDPQYTRTLAGLYEERGHYKDAMTAYQMALKENPDDEVIQQKIAELEQLQGFQNQASETGMDLGSLLSQEEIQTEIPEDAEMEAPVTDSGSGLEEVSGEGEAEGLITDLETRPEEVGAEVQAEGPDSPEMVDITQSSAFDRELNRALSEADNEGDGDRSGEPTDYTAIAEGLPAEESSALEELDDLPALEGEPHGEDAFAAMEDSVVEGENGQLPESEDDTAELSEAPSEPIGSPTNGLDEGTADLPLDEPAPSESPPERGEEAPAEPVPGQASPAMETQKQETIQRLEGLLDRVRSKSEKDKKNTVA